MFKPKIKKENEVVVISGPHKGAKGKVLAINPSDNRPTITIDGVNVRARRRKSGDTVQVVQVPVPIAYSNVAKVESANK